MDVHLTDQRIVVTGGSGFLGQHVVAHLTRLGCRQLFVPRRPLFDLTQPADVARLILQQRPDVVLHLAGQAKTGFYPNLIMGAHLIDACLRGGVRKFVQVGRPGNPAHEALFAMVAAYREQHGFGGVNLLLNELYGPGDDFGPATAAVIPALIRMCSEGREQGNRAIEVLKREKSPEPLFVRDAARAVELAAGLDSAECVQASSGRMIDWTRLPAIIARMTGFQGKVRLMGQVGNLPAAGKVTNLPNLPGFEPARSLEDGLEQTIAWYGNMTGRRHYAAAA